MLDILGYRGEAVKTKHIIDNSCGNGAFLKEIVTRFCEAHKDDTNLKGLLEKYIHGIEINKDNYESCISSLNEIVRGYGIFGVEWDIINQDALKIDQFNGVMDYVVGNPPYVRIHNISDVDSIKEKYKFISSGMVDLYIAFYELSFNMLNSGGRMCLITPNTFLTSIYGKGLRDFIFNEKTLSDVVNVGHFQPFDGISTYTVIMMYDKTHSKDTVRYCDYREGRLGDVSEIEFNDIFIGGKMYFGNKEDLKSFRKISEANINKSVQVKNGFATLADKIFIGDNLDDYELTIKVLKVSSGVWKTAIFPYEENVPISEKILSEKYPKTYKYLLRNKDRLLNRNILNIDEWYLFGRSQAISDVNKDKIAINTTIKDLNSIKLKKVPAGCGVYSGLYVVGDKYSYKEISRVILNEEFIKYIKTIGKHKSGGYYSFSSGDLLRYLSFSLSVGGDK